MSDQGPEAPKDYAESVKSAAGSALDQAEGAYRQASGQVQNATSMWSRKGRPVANFVEPVPSRLRLTPIWVSLVLRVTAAVRIRIRVPIKNLF